MAGGVAQRTFLESASTRCQNSPAARHHPLGPATLAKFRPSDLIGAAYVTWCGGLTTLALWLCAADHWFAWAIGQGILALALLLWFVILHETGHRTLFESRAANDLVGHIAGFFSLIPFNNWRLVHARHHQWTGWQDKDATTESLCPRTLHRVERWLVNAAWRFWIPLFSILYRINNYWNVRRLRRFIVEPEHHRRLARGCATLAVANGLVAYFLGIPELVAAIGPGLVLTFVLQDPIILSQHTHIPQNLARGRRTRPFPAREQERFTRSLRFPNWFSVLFLMRFDAHELHHMYVQVPGYYLRSLEITTANEVDWLKWLKGAKKLRGEEFLFQNSGQTGFTL